MKRCRIFIAAAVLLGLLALNTAPDQGRVVKKIPTAHKIIALTFDDGPHPATTPALLAVLESRKVRATFFVLGEYADRYPALLGRIAGSGHELASHGYRHRIISRQSREELYADLAKVESAIMKVAPAPKLFRPPGGGYNDRVVLALAERGYTTVLWSIDPRDWERPAPAAISAAVIGRAAPGTIILLHEGEAAANTPAALGEIIDRLQAAGYSFVTVGELLQYGEMLR